MKKATLKAEIVAVDKASKNMNIINKAAKGMGGTVTKEANTAGNAFTRLQKKASLAVKKTVVSLNLLKAKANQVGRGISKSFGKAFGALGNVGLAIGVTAAISSIVMANVELDDSLASLSAITGKTGAQFEQFKTQVQEVSKEQLIFAGDTAKAFEVVASAQPILLDNAEALGKVTNAAITLSKASGDDLASSALSLTGVMNQFNLEASEAERTMNALAAGSVAGSANITNVAASMKNFGAVASAANLSVEQSIALVEVMGSKAIFAEDAGNKLKASVLNLQAAGLGYESGLFNMADALEEVKLKVDAARTAKEKDAVVTSIFKKTGIATGQILLNNIGMYRDMTTAVTGTTTAVDQMNIKANTFSNRWNEIRAAYKNSVTATDAQSESMQKLKDAMAFVANNMDNIISVAIKAVKVFLALKAAIVVLNVVTWAMNAAWLANPITWIVVGIVAAIAGLVIGIRALVKNWDVVKAAMVSFYDKIRENPIMALLAQPIIFVVEAVKLLIKSFKDIKNAFQSGGIIAGFKEIGKSIINFMILPFKIFLEALAKIPKVGKFAQVAVDKINNFETTSKIEQESKQLIDITKTDNTSKKVATSNKSNMLVDALNRNTNVVADNTKSGENQWKGKFTTSILKNANISDRTSEIAKTSIINEENVIETQKTINESKIAKTSIINEENILSTQNKLNESDVIKKSILNESNIINKEKLVSNVINESNISSDSFSENIIRQKQISQSDEIITPNSSRRRNETNNSEITVTIIDKTGSNFATEVESTGINVLTTGNE